jgi:hypothetical protein
VKRETANARGNRQSKKHKHFKYSNNWHSKARHTTKMQPLCTNNPFHGDAHIVHHIHYRRSLPRRILGLLLLNLPVKSIAGFEIPGFDIVPVCRECHQNCYGISQSSRSLHYHKIWIQRDGLDNHQHWFTAWRLRLSYLVLFLLGTAYSCILFLWKIVF